MNTTTEVPYFDRTLESFADETITKARPSQDRKGWYATLDVGPTSYVSDPDFSSYAETREAAIRLCATKIRQDAQGIGKYAPHRCLTGYDLHYRLMEYWVNKERTRHAA